MYGGVKPDIKPDLDLGFQHTCVSGGRVFVICTTRVASCSAFVTDLAKPSRSEKNELYPNALSRHVLSLTCHVGLDSSLADFFRGSLLHGYAHV